MRLRKIFVLIMSNEEMKLFLKLDILRKRVRIYLLLLRLMRKAILVMIEK